MTRISALPVFAFGLLLSAQSGVQAQDYMSLPAALDRLATGNRQMRMAEFEKKKAQADMHQTDALFLPQVSAAYQGLVTNNPLNAFGFLLQQGGISQQSFDPERLNSPGITRNYAGSMEVKVPIVNVDLYYARKGAKMAKQAYGYKASYTAERMAFEVKRAYTALQFAYQSKAILDSTLTDVRQICQNVKHFRAQGLVQQSDVMNAEVQVNTVETALAKAANGIADASDGLRILLGTYSEEATPYTVDALAAAAYAGHSPANIANRGDIKAIQAGAEAAKMMERSAKTGFLPRLNAFGSYMFNDPSLFGFNKGGYLAGISLNWNLFDGNQQRSKSQKAKAEQRWQEENLKAYVEQSLSEIGRNERELEQLALEIQKQQASVAQAGEALRVTTNRHKEGLASTTDLLMSQAQYSRHRLEQAEAVMKYNIAVYYNELITNK